MTSLSIVIPLYNKAPVISNTLNLVEKKCNDLNLNFEIIIVENESTDSSLLEAQNWVNSSKSNTKLLNSKKGLGYALKKGIFEAKNDFIMSIPADYCFGESELDYFQLNKEKLPRYVLGSRALPDSYAPTSYFRRFITFGFNTVKKLIINLKMKDTQGTFIIENKLGKELAKESISTEFFITTEFVFRAIKKDILIHEIPIQNKIIDNNKTTVYFVRDSFEMFLNIIRLRKLEGKLKNR